MKYFIKSITGALFFLCLAFYGKAQQVIPYGSNNGKHVLVNKVNIYYEEYGTGPALLLLHGGFSSIENFSPVIPELSKHFRVIAVDCPGQGRSEQAENVSYELMADYFSKMIDLLKLDSVYVFGYSDGGNIGLHLAADRPDKVKRTAVYAAAYHTDGYYPEAIAGLDQLTPEKVERDMKWWLDGHLRKTPQKEQWKKFIEDFRKMCATPVIIEESKLSKIKSRVLILQGDSDIVKPEHAVMLHHLVNASQLCILPAASHFIMYERPELLNTIVIEFLSKEPKLFDFHNLGK